MRKIISHQYHKSSPQKKNATKEDKAGKKCLNKLFIPSKIGYNFRRKIQILPISTKHEQTIIK